MTHSRLAIAALTLTPVIGVATTASASDRVPITATYQPKTKLYCVTARSRDEAEAIRIDFRDRTCMSSHLWRVRGVVFPQPMLNRSSSGQM